MTQTLEVLMHNKWARISLPSPEAEALNGIAWGKAEQLFTPAYWAMQAWIRDISCKPVESRLGTTLTEEVVACLLGGHGISAEVGLAAFERIRHSGLIRWPCERAELYEALSEPMRIGAWSGRYRFARQKSEYVHAALCALAEYPAADQRTARELRDYLTQINGIGPKTASWIVRNWYGADDVAILDIHIIRACQRAGVFHANARLPADYDRLEHIFLAFAQAIGVRASRLDAVMWLQMREMPASLRSSANDGSASPNERPRGRYTGTPRVRRSSK